MSNHRCIEYVGFTDYAVSILLGPNCSFRRTQGHVVDLSCGIGMSFYDCWRCVHRLPVSPVSKMDSITDYHLEPPGDHESDIRNFHIWICGFANIQDLGITDHPRYGRRFHCAVPSAYPSANDSSEFTNASSARFVRYGCRIRGAIR